MYHMVHGGGDRMNATLLPAPHARYKYLRVRLVIEPRLKPLLFNKKRTAQQNAGRASPGGGDRIRTCESLATQHAFQACALNHSATPPRRHSLYTTRDSRTTQTTDENYADYGWLSIFCRLQ